MSVDLRGFIAEGVKLHPRVAYQSLLDSEDASGTIAAALPALPAFRSEYVGALAIIDWDHKLPSRNLVLRVFGYYSEASLEAGLDAYDDRVELIAERDRYPEFDVPDFEGLPADEAYEVELGIDGRVGKCRLTSAWRRTIAAEDAANAVATVQASAEFQQITESSPHRPAFLGDLEAVSWTPPCESEFERWTLDVWYLMAFDGRVGSGRSFLVDPTEMVVITVRDFSVRTG